MFGLKQITCPKPIHSKLCQVNRFTEGSLVSLTESREKLKTEELADVKKDLLILDFGLKSWQLLYSIQGTGTAGSVQRPGESCGQCG